MAIAISVGGDPCRGPAALSGPDPDAPGGAGAVHAEPRPARPGRVGGDGQWWAIARILEPHVARVIVARRVTPASVRRGPRPIASTPERWLAHGGGVQGSAR